MGQREVMDSVKRNRLCLSVVAVAVVLVIAVGAAIASSSTKYPQAGKSVVRDSKLKIDKSNISEGYFMACVSSKSKKKYKLRVIKGDTTLTYDLSNTGEMEVFPLQLGSGNYQVRLYENISGKSYSQAGTIRLSVKLSDPNISFLYPNQYVNYTESSEAVQKADELCEGKTPQQAFDAICRFMKGNFVYDFIKAATIKAGVMPDIDGCYKKKQGVCQDLAAIMVCMLRSQGIPAKLMIGYADKTYHAWVVAIIDGEETFFDPTAQLGAIGKTRKYTVERFY